MTPAQPAGAPEGRPAPAERRASSGRTRVAWALVLLGLATGCGRKATPSTIDAAPASSPRELSPHQRFWSWFAANDDRLYASRSSQVTVLGEIGAALQHVNADLTFELGPVGPDEKRDFVISAGGIKSAFPAVEALFAAAPRLPRWNVIKFRPRRHPVMSVELDGVKLDPARVQYKLSSDGLKLGIDVCVDRMSPATEDRTKQAAYLLLDEALGEYDVETKVGFIELVAQDSKRCDPARHLPDLAGDFDAEYARVTGVRPP
jgi:hypothetical protein